MTPGTVLVGAKVLTMDRSEPIVEAVGLRDGRIAAIGGRAAVGERMGAGAKELDLGGGALLPGFIDPHHHFAYAALDYGTADLRVAGGGAMPDLLRLIAEAVRRKPPGWVYLCGYEPANLAERRAPTADELEECCPGRPLFVQAANGHEGVLNRTGLTAMGWSEATPDPPNGTLRRDRRRRLTGEVVEASAFMAEAAFRERLLEDGADVWLEACKAHAEDLLALGITRVADAAVPPSVERLYQRGAAEGRLPITVHSMPVASTSLLLPRFDGAPTGAGGAGAPVGPAKLFVDGGHRCAVCLDFRQVGWVARKLTSNVIRGGGLSVIRAASRSGRPRLGSDLHLHAGMRFWQREALVEAVGHGAERGFQIAQHAMGNEAIGMALAALRANERQLAAVPGAPRLEHVVFANADQPRQIADVGAVAVVQPRFIEEMGDDMLLTPLPPPIETMPLRSLVDAGVELAASSDYPVTKPDVLAAMKAAVTRQTASGRLLGPEQSIDLSTILRAYTLGAAKALGVEAETGSLEVGKRADLVHLSRDPYSVDPGRLTEIEVSGTWVGGEHVWPTRQAERRREPLP